MEGWEARIDCEAWGKGREEAAYIKFLSGLVSVAHIPRPCHIHYRQAFMKACMPGPNNYVINTNFNKTISFVFVNNGK